MGSRKDILGIRLFAGLLLGSLVFGNGVAQADDLFGDGDSAADEAEPAAQGGSKELLGGLLGSPSDSKGSRRNDQWDDITTEATTETDAAYEQSLEVKMHRELSKDLPTREPFGDKLDDVEKRLGK